MDIKELITFIKVVEAKSFSKAARELFISQSAVSMHIKTLENELSSQLLLRSTKAVLPTKGGLVLYDYAKHIVKLQTQAISTLDKLNHIHEGEIHILSSTIPSQFFLVRKIANFRKRYPKVTFRVEQASSDDVLRRMEHDTCDFGIVGTTPEDTNFTYTPIYDDTFIVAVPDAFPTFQPRLYPSLGSYLQSFPFIFREKGSGTRNEIEKFLAHHHLSTDMLNIVAYFSDSQSVVNAVASGLGISLISKIAIENYEKLNLIKSIPISPAHFSRKFYIATRKNLVLPPRQALFFDFLVEDYQNAQQTTPDKGI